MSVLDARGAGSPHGITTVPLRWRDVDSPIYYGAGVIDSLGGLLKPYTETNEVAVVSDSRVWALHGERIASSLAHAGFVGPELRLELDNTMKVAHTVDRVLDFFVDCRANWGTTVVLVGGNVLIDAAGLAAATFCRGLRFALVPTTLLSQADGAIGGALGVHYRDFTNYVGIRKFPIATFSDPEVLRTLPVAEYRAGMAEIVKQAVVADLDLYQELIAFPPHSPDDHARVTGILGRTIEVKAQLVPDGEDRRLNFGHTIGHALENIMKHKGIRHGEAVSIGMHGEMLLSERLGRVRSGSTSTLKALIQELALPVFLPELAIRAAGSPEALVVQLEEMTWYDKKVFGGKLPWVLPAGNLGTYDMVEADRGLVRDVLRSLVSGV